MEIKKRPSPSIRPEHPSQKRPKLSQSLHPSIIDPYDSPRSIHHTPTVQRTCIGPTPQKDGRILGLFDMLSPESRETDTPSKRTFLGVADPNALATPSKSLLSAAAKQNSNSPVKSNIEAPLSASKLAGPTSFLTPSSHRLKDLQRTPGSRSGVSKLRFDITPAFLRRDSQKTRDSLQRQDTGQTSEELKIAWSPIAVQRRPKPAGRGLSALVQGLRALEDEKLDEEMELMRELENDHAVGCAAQQSCNLRSTVAVGDSQVADMPLGPDGAGSSEVDSDDAQDRERGKEKKPLKVWKKKGQKRSTRKSNMKPSTAKWKPEAQWKPSMNEGSEEEPAVIPETQLAGPILSEDPPISTYETNDMEYITDGESKPENYNNDDNDTTSRAMKGSETKGMINHKRSDGGGKKASTKKKKINPLAHANFRALKIKNKQSKAKGGGRYGRRR